jgi:two-component system, chemotaxis family, chemotaxis protein CheY
MNKVMVVDNSKSVRKLIKYILTAHGYEVMEASDSDAAFCALELESSALTLMIACLSLPASDGMELIRKVRCHPVHHALPIILTAAADEQDRLRQGHLSGASAWIAKPFSMQQVLRTVDLVLKGPGPEPGMPMSSGGNCPLAH